MYWPFTPSTGVQIPLGTPKISKGYIERCDPFFVVERFRKRFFSTRFRASARASGLTQAVLRRIRTTAFSPSGEGKGMTLPPCPAAVVAVDEGHTARQPGEKLSGSDDLPPAARRRAQTAAGRAYRRAGSAVDPSAMAGWPSRQSVGQTLRHSRTPKTGPVSCAAADARRACPDSRSYAYARSVRNDRAAKHAPHFPIRGHTCSSPVWISTKARPRPADTAARPDPLPQDVFFCL